MQIFQERKLSMYAAVIDLIDANAAIVTPLHNFSAIYTPFKTTVSNIQTLQQQQRGTVSVGTTQLKTDLRRNLTIETRKITNALSVYFTILRDPTHNNIVKKAASYWSASADTNFVSDCRNVFDLATTHATDIANYGITAANLTAYATAIDAFQLIIPKPRMTIIDKKAFTNQLETNFTAAKNHLDIITALITTLEFSNTQFYNRFLSAKKIISTGSRVTAFRMAIKSATGTPQTGFTVQLLRQATGDTTIYKTNKNGTLVRQNMMDGTYDITITKNDYTPISGKIALILGETYILELTVDTTTKTFTEGHNPKTGETIGSM
jgi:5-hydroxyisourate hydrolase-like protein (transthyretin family)